METRDKSVDLDSRIKEAINNMADLADKNSINNNFHLEIDDLVFSSVLEEHIPELAELWANHASIQQIFAPNRYNFKLENKDWREFVRNKAAKAHNLLIVVTKKGDSEVRGFMYLQTVSIPSSNLVVKGIIEDLYTKPQYRRQKIASKMLSIGMDWASDNGVKNIELVSITSSKIVEDFYKEFLDAEKKNVELDLVAI